MATTRAMNDEEVHNEMRKMVAFIRQEAMEKAREIKVKADEEFNIEKAKIVRQESTHIEASTERKTKQVEVQRRIAQSSVTNKARLRTLAERDTLLNELFDEVRSHLGKVSENKEKYGKLLRGLLLQGFYQLMEQEVSISCREADVELVQDAIDDAKQLFEKATNQLVEPVLDHENYLSKNSAGGVIVSALGGRIKSANTLENRLDLLSEQMLPDIRILLFGPSPSRRFYH